MPSRKEGIRSMKDTPFGLNAKKVMNLNKVKIARKIRKRLITHKIVLGILYFASIRSIKDGASESDHKRIEFMRVLQKPGQLMLESC
jgi:hypothetical protein